MKRKNVVMALLRMHIIFNGCIFQTGHYYCSDSFTILKLIPFYDQYNLYTFTLQTQWVPVLYSYACMNSITVLF
jgi:hypothetical protein